MFSSMEVDRNVEVQTHGAREAFTFSDVHKGGLWKPG